VGRESGRVLMLLLVLIVVLAGVIGWWWLNPAKAPGWARERLPWLFVTETVVYRWQDDQGQWHVSDQPPDDHPYEVVRYRSDANVLPPDAGS